MARTSVLIGEANTNKIFKVGQVGYDSGAAGAPTSDPNSTSFTGSLKTERMSPAGEGALVRFRRVVLRAYKVGGWKVTFTIWVDDVQTQIFDNTNIDPAATAFNKVDQTIEVSSDTDDTGEGEAVIEADIDAHGTFIQVLVELTSTDIDGYFLPESLEVHCIPLRETKSRDGAESQ